jgi:predicted RNase H-like nuclease
MMGRRWQRRKRSGAWSILPRELLDLAAPRGAASDDFLDACAMLLIAERHQAGLAIPFPDPPLLDDCGIPIAIWT